MACYHNTGRAAVSCLLSWRRDVPLARYYAHHSIRSKVLGRGARRGAATAAVAAKIFMSSEQWNWRYFYTTPFYGSGSIGPVMHTLVHSCSMLCAVVQRMAETTSNSA
ncbi:hypothetical protein SFRURICE_003857 [Spodoptera frugiperda]|nr:hypothetical protein SFRURICE_003857 [Spodoptera frugiperda]